VTAALRPGADIAIDDSRPAAPPMSVAERERDAGLSVLHVSYTDAGHGAARAAYRIHRALLDVGAVESRMLVRRKHTDDWTVASVATSVAAKAMALTRPDLGALAARLQRCDNSNLHSANFVPSRLAAAAGTAEVVNLHWIGAETMSIEDVGRISKPLVFTLHDMWAFCGAEHYAADDVDARWRHGYRRSNRPASQAGFDLDRWTWRRKARSWRRLAQVICPSRWLADCARSSALMREWPVTVIPNALDTEVFSPRDRRFCRQALGLPTERRIVLFGAVGAEADRRKGYDLLVDALRCWQSMRRLDHVAFVIFGQSAPRHLPDLPVPPIWLGHLTDDVALALLYGAADVMVVPSRQENLVQTGTEAQACGCPVVAFATTGMSDVVHHRKTGYLASAYDTADLAGGIDWVLEDGDRREQIGAAARERAVRLWAPAVVSAQYRQIYEAARDRE
jgi:glycosyltransferase involved in cell wall biosynthesis